jgi:hypothetical protein
LLLPVLRRDQRETVKYNAPDATLALFLKIWPTIASYRELRRQIAWHTKNIAEIFCLGHGDSSAQGGALLPNWSVDLWRFIGRFSFTRCFPPEIREHITVLSSLFQLPDANLPEGQDLDRLLKDDDTRDLFARLMTWGLCGLVGHLGLWTALLWLYPHYSWVQAVFFWNPPVRKLFGLHLTWLIPLVPFARRRLLAPFRPALGPKPEAIGTLSLADLGWFPDSEVIEDGTQKRMPIILALRRIQGLTVLEGSSGLGKTMYLARLAHMQSSAVVAFIKAGEEGGDVVKAIAARLPSRCHTRSGVPAHAHPCGWP